MDENTIRSVLRSDARVKEMITARAYQIYLEHQHEERAPDENWLQAEREIVDELTHKLIEAEVESWAIVADKDPSLQPGRAFATLVGFMLATGGKPTRADLYNARYFSIGLSYITGMFQIGRTLAEEQFLKQFSNDEAVVQALLYRIRTNADSPYYTTELGDDWRVGFANDEELMKFLSYAENEARKLFGIFKKMLLAAAAPATT